jgi:hypothetical protein
MQPAQQANFPMAPMMFPQNNLTQPQQQQMQQPMSYVMPQMQNFPMSMAQTGQQFATAETTQVPWRQSVNPNGSAHPNGMDSSGKAKANNMSGGNLAHCA